MSNNNVNNNQPNNPYELSNDNPYGHLPVNNKQNGFLRFMPEQSSNHIVRNQLSVAKFKIGDKEVTVPEEYAEAFGALHKFWYNDMLGDYLVEQHNVLVDNLYSKSEFLKDWKNEINFFLENLATACTRGDLSPEYLNILVYNENYGIIHLKDWLVNFCTSCSDINGTLKEPMCFALELQNKNFKCPTDYVCQTQQNWLTSTNVLKEGGLPTTLYQNEGANFLLKKALEKYLDKISESPANSELSTKELQEIIYNFKIASEQCRQGLPHGANNTLINVNTTDIPYELPNDNPTVTKKSDKNTGAVVGSLLGIAFGIAAGCIIYGGCKYYKEEKSFFSSLTRTCGETWDKIKTFFNNCCKKKGQGNNNNRSIKNGNQEDKNNNTGKSRNNRVGSTVIVNNNENIATSKSELDGKESLYKKNGKINKAYVEKGVKELEDKLNKNRDEQYKKEQGEESIEKGKGDDESSKISSDIQNISILQEEMKENMKEVNEKNSEMKQKEINNNKNPVNIETLNEHLKNDGSVLKK